MREIHVEEIRDKVAQIYIAAAYSSNRDDQPAMDRSGHTPAPAMGGTGHLLCQDTGIAVFFVEVGQDLRIKNGFVVEAVSEGVRKAYRDENLPKSIVDPLTRKNTGDSIPAIIYTELVPGDRLRISFMPGEGAPARGDIRMLDPSAGVEGIKSFVCECAHKACHNSHSPVVIGVGIGGNFEKAALLAKKALLRPEGGPNPKLELSSLEEVLVKAVNKTGIDLQGRGGAVRALAVHVESYPCHRASLPVAVTVNCCGGNPITVLF